MIEDDILIPEDNENIMFLVLEDENGESIKLPWRYYSWEKLFFHENGHWNLMYLLFPTKIWYKIQIFVDISKKKITGLRIWYLWHLRPLSEKGNKYFHKYINFPRLFGSKSIWNIGA